MRHPFSPRRTGGLWQALLLLLTLVLAGQSIAVQTHRHDPAHACAETANCKTGLGRADSGRADSGKSHKADHCALCEEARTAGHYLPVADVFVLVAVVAAFCLPVAHIAARPRLPARAPWQSRAPPALRPIAPPAF